MTLTMPMQEFFRMIWTRAPNGASFVIALELIEIVKQQNPEEFEKEFVIEEPNEVHSEYRRVTKIESWKASQEILARLKAAEELEQSQNDLSTYIPKIRKLRAVKSPLEESQNEMFKALMKGIM